MTSTARSAHTRTAQGQGSSRRLKQIMRRPPSRHNDSSLSLESIRSGTSLGADSRIFHESVGVCNDDLSQFQFSIDPSQYYRSAQCDISGALTLDDDSVYYDDKSVITKQQQQQQPLPDDFDQRQWQRHQIRTRKMIMAGADNSIPTMLTIIGNGQQKTMMYGTGESCSTRSMCDHTLPTQPRGSQYSLMSKGISTISFDSTTSATDESSSYSYEYAPPDRGGANNHDDDESTKNPDNTPRYHPQRRDSQERQQRSRRRQPETTTATTT